MDECYLLVGLGNPGMAYENTRHNIGFMIIDELTQDVEIPLRHESSIADAAEAKIGTRKVVFAKPLTFMNRSGLAVSSLIERYDVSRANLLIILDDFNLPFGQLRFRGSGSDGGHRGLESIIYELQTTEFSRLRVGIGQDDMAEQVDFVLGDFDEEEQKLLPGIVDRSAAGCLNFIHDGISETMNTFNQTTN